MKIEGERLVRIYKNLDGDSGIVRFDYGSDWIEIEFRGGSLYRYTNASAGSGNIDEMKRLADLGDGLNSFIMRNAKNSYASKR